MVKIRSFEYNTICDVCGFKMDASKLRQRWDGLMVCEKDWEQRHIADFYRTRNDSHLLPFTRPDDTSGPTWTPTTTGITNSPTVSGSYTTDDSHVVRYRILVTPGTSSPVLTAATFSLPVGTVSVDHGGVAMLSDGTIVGSIAAGATIGTVTCTVQASPLKTLIISGSYTKV